MPGMGDEFEAAKRYQSNAARIRDAFRQDPEAMAANVPAVIAEMMERWRFGEHEPAPRDLVEATAMLDRINLYGAFGELLRRIDGYADDRTLSAGELAEKVCAVGVEALEVFESSQLHTLQQVRAWAEDDPEAAAVARDIEARHLSAHLATRISLSPNRRRSNRRLAAMLDEIREQHEAPSRERFKALLRELYAYASETWDDHHNIDLRLRATRSAVVKKIEQRLRPEPPEIELAAFADREALLE
ncbi:MAG: hypothetical protein M3338_03985, partial [Actinomycetota bacterium]|nr:hypothetical protein [Actinomycetota bacterium]